MQTEVMQTNLPKRRKSVVLSKEEHKAFKALRKSYNTSVECSEALGVKLTAFGRILLVGSGSPENIEKIRAAIESTRN